jgi:hypothetical protein
LSITKLPFLEGLSSSTYQQTGTAVTCQMKIDGILA